MIELGAIYSRRIGSGNTTYFVEVKEAKDGKQYLSISKTSRGKDDSNRTTIRFYGEAIGQFRQMIDEAASYANQ